MKLKTLFTNYAITLLVAIIIMPINALCILIRDQESVNKARVEKQVKGWRDFYVDIFDTIESHGTNN